MGRGRGGGFGGSVKFSGGLLKPYARLNPTPDCKAKCAGVRQIKVPGEASLG